MDFTSENLKTETFLDIQLPGCYKLYKTQQQSFWTPEEVDLTLDADSFAELPEEDKHLIKRIVTFFLISDAVVIANIDNIANALNYREIKAFYAIQNAIENVHIEVYSKIFSTIFDHQDPDVIIKEIQSMPSVIKKREFCVNASVNNISKLLIENIFIEGIFFASSFSGILWLKKRGKCPGLVKANEWIARDERLHWRFGCEVFKKFYSSVLSTEDVFEIVRKVYEIEKDFIDEILPIDIGDMTKESLYEYVKFCCNEILEYLGFEHMFENPSQPFDFMKFLNYPTKANFFETRVTNYSLPSDGKEFVYKTENRLVYKKL